MNLNDSSPKMGKLPIVTEPLFFLKNQSILMDRLVITQEKSKKIAMSFEP